MLQELRFIAEENLGDRWRKKQGNALLLNGVVLDTLLQLSRKVHSPVISVENPQNSWQYTTPVSKLIASPGWHKRTVDHCSNLDVHDVLKVSLASKGQQEVICTARRVRPLHEIPVKALRERHKSNNNQSQTLS